MQKEFIEMFQPTSTGSLPPQQSKFKRLNRIIKHFNINEIGKKSVNSDPVKPDNSSSATLKPKPVINIKKAGELIKQIEVVCSCGENILIDLEYE